MGNTRRNRDFGRVPKPSSTHKQVFYYFFTNGGFGVQTSAATIRETFMPEEKKVFTSGPTRATAAVGGGGAKAAI